jgi:ubiquinone/menaquinone biosynthesis C-methylase UbiE
MNNLIEKFTPRVTYYERYRPSYPMDLLWLMEKEIGFDVSDNVADIGSGTGILSKLFVQNGNIVFAVEPNNAMRAVAEEKFRNNFNFISISGTAENTKLEDSSIDVIVSGQAFHWFDIKKVPEEFKRILVDNGYVVLVWNERKEKKKGIMYAYEKICRKYGTDYEKYKCSKEITVSSLNKIFGVRNFKYTEFEVKQYLSFEGIKGRLLSSSFIPLEGLAYKEMIKELKTFFSKYQHYGKVLLEYKTRVFYGKVK